MPTNRLGWRIYVCHGEWMFYSYTIIGARGEAEAMEIVKTIITPGELKLTARLGTVNMDDYPPPPPPPEENQS